MFTYVCAEQCRAESQEAYESIGNPFFMNSKNLKLIKKARKYCEDLSYLKEIGFQVQNYFNY